MFSGQGGVVGKRFNAGAGICPGVLMCGGFPLRRLVRQAERLHKQQKKKAEEHRRALEGAAQDVASLSQRIAAGESKCERLEKLVGEKEAQLSESRERIERLEMQVCGILHSCSGVGLLPLLYRGRG